MEKTVTQFRKCGEDTRQRLLATSLKLIWENSYGSVSVDDICKQAEVKKGSFYHFFESKSELMVAAFDEQWNQIKKNYDESFSSSLSPIDRFKHLCRSAIAKQKSQLSCCGRICGCPYISIGSELCGIDDKVRAKSAELIQRSIAYYESAIIEAKARGDIPDCDPKTKANELFNFMTGAMVQARIRNDISVLDGLENGILMLLCQHSLCQHSGNQAVRL